MAAKRSAAKPKKRAAKKRTTRKRATRTTKDGKGAKRRPKAPKAKKASKRTRTKKSDVKLRRTFKAPEDHVPQKYAIAHAFNTTSYVARMKEDGGEPDVIRLRKDAQKEQFLHLKLQPGDTIYMDLGGPGDRVALIARLRGVTVLRIPTFKLAAHQPLTAEADDGEKPLDDAERQPDDGEEPLKEEEEREEEEKEEGKGKKKRKEEEARANQRVRDYVASHGWKIGDEKQFGGETGEKLTARKARALALAVAATNEPELFLPMGADDERILEIQRAYRGFRVIQVTIISAFQRLVAEYNDEYVLEIARDPKVLEESNILDGNRVHAKTALRAIRSMLVKFPEDQREAFIARLGLDKLEGKRIIPRKDLQGMFKKILDELMEQSEMSPVVADMKRRKTEIERLLKDHPVYENVFKPIPGCGPLIAARLMGGIVDIRRFSKRPELTAFEGYHHFEDGSRARRIAGQTSNWNMEAKQATYQFTQQVVKMPDSEWRARLDLRRAYELYKLLKERQTEAEEEKLDYKILPAAYRDREIEYTYSMTPADIGILNAHVDALRKQAGVKFESEEDEDEEPEVRDPKLAKLVRGLKQKALDKAYRWLGQQFIKYVFKQWKAFEKSRQTTSEGEQSEA